MRKWQAFEYYVNILYCSKCETIFENCHDTDCWIDKARRTLKALPTIEAKPVVHSYWHHMVSGIKGMEDPFMCDNCCYIMEAENIMNNHDALRYCSSCGARMDYVDTSGGKMEIGEEGEE